ncbi:MAG: hypothetical protein ACFFCS_01840 [Candidatus Hodarchaeota archaeon]
MGEREREEDEDTSDEEEISLEDLPSKIMELDDGDLKEILKGNGAPGEKQEDGKDTS